ncbi:hypothetical protein GGR53DRAFT_179396 [Hypoxylon sp. FL1150]|nr:hypothetical protein GGR53DRAFT_179396 [Hypoxylon sp. FL1150]
MMGAAVDEVVTGPILVDPNPKTMDDALSNTLAFSYEGRQSQLRNDARTMIISSTPRMRQCFGWVKVDGHILLNWPRRLRPPTIRIDQITRSFSADKEYIGIIYEYVEEGENDRVIVEEVANFLWRAGFGYTRCSAARNWKNGVLIDLSDIVHVSGYGWRPNQFGPRKAERILKS